MAFEVASTLMIKPVLVEELLSFAALSRLARENSSPGALERKISSECVVSSFAEEGEEKEREKEREANFTLDTFANSE